MKFLLLSALFLAFTAQANQKIQRKIHILPDAPGWVYLQKYSPTRDLQAPDDVALAIKLGERNLAWLNHMNTLREDGKKLQLTKPGDLKGYPIEAPNKYNAKTVKARYQELAETMPAEMKDVLYTSKEFPDDPPVAEETYIQWAKDVDRNYQTAVRWTMMKPYLAELEFSRYEDLRGFYYLSKKTDNVERTLRSFDTLPNDRKKEIRTWLLQMCYNSDGPWGNCSSKTDLALSKQQAYEFYLKYLPGSQKIWDSYFSLHNPRPEVVWTKGNPLKMLVPFQDPNDAKILDFLKLNIEDEWKWDQWNLVLDFKPSTDIHVEFQPGVTPHVNGLGGNTIVMDKNAPLTEWDVQWTIRHEFGHVLGFTDCYLEFYEPDEDIIITYQLDIQNMMCARSGRMQEGHYQTLKNSYLK